MSNFILDINNFETYVAACASRVNVVVSWDEPGSIPRTNGKQMFLPRITSSYTAEDMTRLRYYVKHETEHIAHTDFNFHNEHPKKGLLQFITNILEDNRIDHINDAMYEGDRRLSNEYMTLFAKDIQEKKGEVREQDVTGPLYAWDAMHRDTPAALLCAEEFVKGLSSDSSAKLDKLLLGNYGKRLKALRESPTGGTTDLLSLAEDILKDIYGEDPKKYEKKPEESEGKGKDKKKNKEDGDEEEEGEGEGTGDESSEGDGDGEDDDEGIITVKEMSKGGADHLSSTKRGIHWEHSPDTSSSYVIPSAKDYIVTGFPLDSSKGFRAPYYSGMDRSTVNSNIDNIAKPLSNKLRHRLQVRAQGRYENGKKKGSLHGGSLHRLITSKNTDNETRVFRKHIVSDTLDTAVSLLVDCSGSMSGSKFNLAATAGAALSMALKPLHIAHAMHGFTNAMASRYNEAPVIFKFSPWGDNVSREELVERFYQAGANLGDNSDGDAIAWVAWDLMQRKEHRKILIVLSDGSPSGRWWAGDITGYTKKVVRDIEASKHIEIYGIGIMDTNVRMYYKNHTVINRADELPSAVLSIIDKSV